MSTPANPTFATISRLVSTAVAVHEALAGRIGLNPTDLRCLGLIGTEPGLTPTRLAELAGLTTGAITGVLDRLEQVGFVQREADPADRRRLVVTVDPRRIGELERTYAPIVAAAADLGADASDLDRLSLALGAEAERLRVSARGGLIGDTYFAPLGNVTRGRLLLATGAPRLSLGGAALGQQVRMVAETSASRLHLSALDASDELVRARFEGPPPDVRTSDGAVAMRYRRRLLDTRSRTAHVGLQRAVLWTVEVEGGITDLEGDLRGVRLDALEVRGGANHLKLRLAAPGGTARILFGGGSSDARFSRPAEVAVSLRVHGGVSRLRFDDRCFDGVTGDLHVTSDGFASAAERYEIEFSGGASNLRITTER